MNTFPHIPASKQSLANRSPVFSIGINDADYIVKPVIDGKQVICPLYSKWRDMLQRCYSPALHRKRPTYIGCTVAKEWLTFSVFRSWMVGQDWQGNDLDKDLLSPGNKIYGPDTCVFVSSQVNTLLSDCGAARGPHPQGVYWNKRDGKFQAQIRMYSKRKHLGCHPTPEEASAAYIKAKAAHIIEVAQTQPDNIKVALLRHAEAMR